VRLAVWNIRPCSLLFGSDDVDGIEVRYGDPVECKALLDAGEVDVALIAVNDALREVDSYRLLSQAVLASASTFPWATLQFKDGIEGIRSVEVLQGHRQAGEVAEIFLREEYDVDVKVRSKEALSTNGESADALVVIENPSDALDADNRWLDVGQEWFELTALPLPWGVFAVRTENPTALFGELLDVIISRSLKEEAVAAWLDGHPSLTERESSAIESDLRYRFDEEVMAGIGELAHYLFYYGKVEDVPSPRFAKPPESVRPSE
jgi:predicted solute-binding protein